jgi:hypothetical protein
MLALSLLVPASSAVSLGVDSPDAPATHALLASALPSERETLPASGPPEYSPWAPGLSQSLADGALPVPALAHQPQQLPRQYLSRATARRVADGLRRARQRFGSDDLHLLASAGAGDATLAAEGEASAAAAAERASTKSARQQQQQRARAQAAAGEAARPAHSGWSAGPAGPRAPGDANEAARMQSRARLRQAQAQAAKSKPMRPEDLLKEM